MVGTDTSSKTKRSFISRLFSKRQQKKVQKQFEDKNSQLHYNDRINQQLDTLAQLAKKNAYTNQLKEYLLQKDHQDTQLQITGLLSWMEEYQLNKIRSRSTDAISMADSLSKYVGMLGFSVPLLLIISLTIFIVYLRKNKRHADLLNLSRQNAIKIANEKEKFLADMSHEIRTPMNAIAGFAKLLDNDQLDDSAKQYVKIITDSADHLSHILNDVLDYTKMQEGKINLEKKSFHIGELARSVVHMLQEKAFEKGLTIDLDISCNTLDVVGDPYRLKQIILNLVHNAIKFTHQGGVSIAIYCRGTTQDSVTVEFNVTDTGIGISQDHLDNIFKEFEQVGDGNQTRGAGLGLTISKRLVLLQQGEINVRSKKDKGTTFIFTIPYQLADKPKPLPELSADSYARLKGVHVLIADDEKFNRRLLTEICKKYQMTYDQAVDGQEAYEKLKDHRYDFVLMDFRMPVMTGPQVAKKIKQASSPNSGTTIIGLTASVSDKDMQEAKEAGITHVIRKPFEIQELLGMLSEETGEIQPGSNQFVKAT
ncbi:MAG: ATP-binding protein, partial [Bacteroidota bacterium]